MAEIFDQMACIIDRLELSDITLIVQDWGGLLGLSLLGEFPERFKRIVILNTFLPKGRPLYFAYSKLANRYKNDLNKLVAIGQLNNNELLDVWLKLDLIKYYIQHNDLTQSQQLIKELLSVNPNKYFLVTACEYDANYRTIPKRCLQNLCFIVYHLVDNDEKLLLLSDLMKIKDQTNFELTKSIIGEILLKLRNGIWKE